MGKSESNISYSQQQAMMGYLERRGYPVIGTIAGEVWTTRQGIIALLEGLTSGPHLINENGQLQLESIITQLDLGLPVGGEAGVIASQLMISKEAAKLLKTGRGEKGTIIIFTLESRIEPNTREDEEIYI